jgi:ankyrin repeat protein
MVNNLEHCHLLAEAGADPLSLDEAGDTVLHDAAEFRDDDGKDQPLKVET